MCVRTVRSLFCCGCKKKHLGAVIAEKGTWISPRHNTVSFLPRVVFCPNFLFLLWREIHFPAFAPFSFLALSKRKLLLSLCPLLWRQPKSVINSTRTLWCELGTNFFAKTLLPTQAGPMLALWKAAVSRPVMIKVTSVEAVIPARVNWRTPDLHDQTKHNWRTKKKRLILVKFQFLLFSK